MCTYNIIQRFHGEVYIAVWRFYLPIVVKLEISGLNNVAALVELHIHIV